MQTRWLSLGLLVGACGVDEEIHKATLDNLKRCEQDLADTQKRAEASENEGKGLHLWSASLKSRGSPTPAGRDRFYQPRSVDSPSPRAVKCP